jgi:hypothetical protein
MNTMKKLFHNRISESRISRISLKEKSDYCIYLLFLLHIKILILKFDCMEL